MSYSLNHHSDRQRQHGDMSPNVSTANGRPEGDRQRQAPLGAVVLSPPAMTLELYLSKRSGQHLCVSLCVSRPKELTTVFELGDKRDVLATPTHQKTSQQSHRSKDQTASNAPSDGAPKFLYVFLRGKFQNLYLIRRDGDSLPTSPSKFVYRQTVSANHERAVLAALKIASMNVDCSHYPLPRKAPRLLAQLMMVVTTLLRRVAIASQRYADHAQGQKVLSTPGAQRGSHRTPTNRSFRFFRNRVSEVHHA